MAKPGQFAGGKGAGEPAREKRWLSLYPNPLLECDVTPAEYTKAVQRARAALFKGRRPAPRNRRPRFVMTIGPPGSGKSTVVSEVIRDEGRDPGTYVNIDLDAAVDYHPRYKGMWGIPDVFGDPTDVGYAGVWMECRESLQRMMGLVLDEAVEGRYDVIYQAFNYQWLAAAKTHGYDTELVYVGAPIETVIARARDRAVTTGKFIAPNLQMQDASVRSAWYEDVASSSWYAMWADSFVVVANPGRPGQAGRPGGYEKIEIEEVGDQTPNARWYVRIDPHEGEWTAALAIRHAAVEAAAQVRGKNLWAAAFRGGSEPPSPPPESDV